MATHPATVFGELSTAQGYVGVDIMEKSTKRLEGSRTYDPLLVPALTGQKYTFINGLEIQAMTFVTALHFSRHFLSQPNKDPRRRASVCVFTLHQNGRALQAHGIKRNGD